jgi:hypothetical protein
MNTPSLLSVIDDNNRAILQLRAIHPYNRTYGEQEDLQRRTTQMGVYDEMLRSG